MHRVVVLVAVVAQSQELCHELNLIRREPSGPCCCPKILNALGVRRDLFRKTALRSIAVAFPEQSEQCPQPVLHDCLQSTIFSPLYTAGCFSASRNPLHLWRCAGSWCCALL